MKNKTFEKLALSLKQLPGISKKQAEKISFYIIQSKTDILKELLETLKNARDNLQKCQKCNLISEDKICNICSDTSRENKLMIVESNIEVNKFENLEIYKGKYFVLDFLIKNLDDKKSYEEKYESILANLSQTEEVVLALSPTIDGEISAIYIKNLIKKNFPKLKVSQLANGLPVGSQVEYMDNLTLNLAFKNRGTK